jgi:2-phospho-L-lactate/phosphoenolpyruvate guanylyltransferase
VRTAAVLPVKSFPQAKSRTALQDPQRAALAEAMMTDVLSALTEVEALSEILVVTREPAAVEAAARVGATVVDDPHEAGHNPAAALGARAAAERGAERVLLVPGDCPGLDPAEVATLLEDREGGVTVVPDRHGSGTNALLIAPPQALAPSFGPGSFARHAALTRAAGLRLRVADVPSLAFDVDTPEDLAALRSAGPRTRALLGVLTA